MPDNRKHPRYQSLARVRIPGILEGDNLLKDLSITGCCIESTTLADLQPSVEYQLEVEPEGLAKIETFQLSVEQKWVHSGGYSTEVGFSIIASPRGKQFQRYVDYLTFRASQA